MAMIKAVIFDLDGTLADTLETLAYYGNKTLEHIGLPPIETQRFRYLVGRGARVLMEDMLISSGREPAGMPACMSMVPMPPSSIRKLSATNDFKSIAFYLLRQNWSAVDLSYMLQGYLPQIEKYI